MTKAGRSIPRWMLVQAAHRALRTPGPVQRFYLKLNGKKDTKVGIAAVARKLLAIIWVLVTRNEEYREPSPRYEDKVRKMERLVPPYQVIRTSKTEVALMKLLAEDLPSSLVVPGRACAFS